MAAGFPATEAAETLCFGKMWLHPGNENRKMSIAAAVQTETNCFQLSDSVIDGGLGWSL